VVVVFLTPIPSPRTLLETVPMPCQLPPSWRSSEYMANRGCPFINRNKECDYSAAYVVLNTSSDLKGQGMTFSTSHFSFFTARATCRAYQMFVHEQLSVVETISYVTPSPTSPTWSRERRLKNCSPIWELPTTTVRLPGLECFILLDPY
jgi:hypothetical protein